MLRYRPASGLLTLVALAVTFVPSVQASAIGCADGWVPSAAPGIHGRNGELHGITAVGDEAWAVGREYDNDIETPRGPRPLILHLQNGAWTQVSPASIGHPISADFNDVSGSSPTDVWAVGTVLYSSLIALPLIERWDGTAWRSVRGPRNVESAVLHSVAARAVDDAWVVGTSIGDDLSLLVWRWNGTRWASVPTPAVRGDVSVQEVFALAENDAWLVGYQDDAGVDGLIEHWDGVRWSIVPIPAIQGWDYLLGIGGTEPDDLWAVGVQSVGGVALTVTLHWDGVSWARVPSPTPPPQRYVALYGVVAVGADDVWAVGYADGGEGREATLVLRWDGEQWSIDPSAAPVDRDSLIEEAARVGDALVGVGSWGSFVTNDRQPLIERRCP
jgi:hypothetical protein